MYNNTDDDTQLGIDPLTAGAVAKVAVPFLLKPARRRTAAQQDAIRRNMVDTAVAAYRAGRPTVSVTNPSNKTESGAPLTLLRHWATNMATASGRAYASQQLQALQAQAVPAPLEITTAAPAPKPLPPVVQETVQAALSTPEGQELVQQYGQQVATEFVQQKVAKQAEVAKAALPLLVIALLAGTVLTRGRPLG